MCLLITSCLKICAPRQMPKSLLSSGLNCMTMTFSNLLAIEDDGLLKHITTKDM